ncbi:ribonuclease P [Listeria sp. FSL L7-1509]|uniref:Ribonuclease P n=1 Tax=Listeria immobilis TaxID=2713502 RepID=A0ABR6SU25_9LIST|nr:ribonuclease P [Listeria immobilis]MBC1484610.1 ribonuclease P [Listeria immobilis]MBC1505382.1 ribonuclease P [Listeria immobilis]MBC1509186.1 ribonuclease P [Listeria immobilis]MBC6304642.1 ribonuclease P [Listeria immobilis]MBC6313617.1 ribonuclease P [Listeria immobilis]
MDATYSKLEQHLQQVQKEKTTAETHIDQTRIKQNKQDWLEEDTKHFEQEKLELLEYLRTGWLGEEANGFHRFLEDQQQEEAIAWKKDLHLKKAHLEMEQQENKAQLHALETKQTTLQKERRA